MKKLFILSTLAILSVGLLSQSTNSLNQNNHEVFGFDEFASDYVNVEGYQLSNKRMTVGADSVVDVSPTFVQFGLTTYEGHDVYVVRYATAVKGDISSVTYQRGAVEGKEDVDAKEVNVLYKGISVGDQVYYYDEVNNDVSTDESLMGNYYWACYTIRYLNADFYSANIPLTISVNGDEKQTKTASFDSLYQQVEDGSETYPYLIKDTDSWNAYTSENESNKVKFDNKHFKLMDNVTIVGKKKMGIVAAPFGGVFDGNNYTITCNYDFEATAANQGVFGTISSTAVIKDLKVAGKINTLNTAGANIGSIVGVNKGGLIENCVSTVDITAKGYNVGGLVGVSDFGTIRNSIFKGTITSTSSTKGNSDHGIGGIVGYATTVGLTTIDNCDNEGAINTGSTQVAGIVGLAKGTSTIRHIIKDCENKANVTTTANVNSTTNEGTGGIAGMALYTNISNCVNNGNITGEKSCQVAGIAGKCSDSSNITNCVNNGTIIGISQVGGISGRHVGNALADQCTNNGDVYCTSNTTTYGQICGHNGAKETNCVQNGTASIVL